MGVVRAILVFIEVLTSVLLVAVILVQKTKDEGLGLALGGGMGETLFGSRAGNVLTRLTIILAAIFLVNTAILAVVHSKRGESSLMGSVPARAGRREARPPIENAPPAPVEPGPTAAPIAPAVPESGAVEPPAEAPAVPPAAKAGDKPPAAAPAPEAGAGETSPKQ